MGQYRKNIQYDGRFIAIFDYQRVCERHKMTQVVK